MTRGSGTRLRREVDPLDRLAGISTLIPATPLRGTCGLPASGYEVIFPRLGPVDTLFLSLPYTNVQF